MICWNDANSHYDIGGNGYDLDPVMLNRAKKLINNLSNDDLKKLLNNTRIEIRAVENSRTAAYCQGTALFENPTTMKIFYKDKLILSETEVVDTESIFVNKNEILRKGTLWKSEFELLLKTNQNFQELVKKDLSNNSKEANKKNSNSEKINNLKNFKELVLIDSKISKKETELINLIEKRNKILSAILKEHPDFLNNNTNRKRKNI